MSKLSQYFDSIEALEAYYVDGVPSKVLAYVKDEEGNYLLYTSTNNLPNESGSSEEIGGYVTDPEVEEELVDLQNEVFDATEKSEEIQYGPVDE